MGKTDTKTTEKEKLTRICDEENKLLQLFDDLPANEKELLRYTAHEIAFIKVTLEDLKHEINKNGPIEDGVHGTKLNANLTAYQNLIKTYQSAILKLRQQLPADKETNKLQAFIDDEDE